MAKARVQHVRRSQRRASATRCALRLDVEPQLRGAARPTSEDPSGEPGDGRCRCRHRTSNRREDAMSFEPFLSLTGIAAPLLRANLDTDVIIRIERLTTTAPSELARFAFEALRYRDDGSEEPSFVLNRGPF